MIQLAAIDPKIFLSQTELLKNEFVFWQEHNRLLISEKEKTAPYESLFYEIAWDQRSPTQASGILLGGSTFKSRWDVSARGNRVDMTFEVTNLGDAS